MSAGLSFVQLVPPLRKEPGLNYSTSKKEQSIAIRMLYRRRFEGNPLEIMGRKGSAAFALWLPLVSVCINTIDYVDQGPIF